MTNNPQILFGTLWAEGYALDVYSVESKFVGYNEKGQEIFDTKRSGIGELLFQLKYRQNYKCVDEIVSCAVAFLKKWISNKNIELIVPAPFSFQRQKQPVFLIAEKISSVLNIPCRLDLLSKTSLTQSKSKNDNMNEIEIKATNNDTFNTNVLFIDDIFGTGKTANACIKVLKEKYNVKNVYLFCVAVKRKRII